MNMISKPTQMLIQDIDTSAIDFEVDRRPVFGVRDRYTPDGRLEEVFEPIEDRFEFFRKDTGKTLGVHTGSYRHNGYKQHIDKVLEAVKEMGSRDQIDLSGAPVNFSVYEGGRKLKLDITFPNNIIEPKVGDITKLRLRDWDSYDGSWGRRLWIDGLRLWCLNGCTSPAFKLGFYAKHTKSLSSDESIHRMVTSMERMVTDFYENEAKFKRWINTPVTFEDGEQMFSKTLAFQPKAVKEDGEWKHHSVNTMDDLREKLGNNFRQVGANMYGVYNAATEWATHVNKTRGEVHNVERTRESKVASMLKSNAWNKLERFSA